jgi:hypothetical protein
LEQHFGASSGTRRFVQVVQLMVHSASRSWPVYPRVQQRSIRVQTSQFCSWLRRHLSPLASRREFAGCKPPTEACRYPLDRG